MKPLLKWPGGKTREIAQINGMIPDYDRYIEPFFGGGALYFHLMPHNALINDASTDLMDFYRMVKSQDRLFRDCLMSYADSFQGIIELGRAHGEELLALLAMMEQDLNAAEIAMDEHLDRWFCQIMDLFSYPLVLDRSVFHDELRTGLWDKLCRTRLNNQKKPFSKDDLVENLVTGLASGYYLYFRGIYNDWKLGRLHLTIAQRSANFFFIRETCYGSMFRYNRAGEFNIPYGGMSYNSKDFNAKIQAVLQPETVSLFAATEIYSRDFEEFLDKVQPTERDFLFLDPPYDTEFSDYEGNAFTRFDQARLAVLLSKTKAKFMLIIKNTDFIHSLYRDNFHIRTFNLRYAYNVRSRNDRSAEHLIITNYKFDED